MPLLNSTVLEQLQIHDKSNGLLRGRSRYCLCNLNDYVPVGAWAVFAYGTIHAALFLIFGWMTVNGKWAEVEVKASAEGYIVPAILLVFHLIIMFNMSDNLWSCSRSNSWQVGCVPNPKNEEVTMSDPFQDVDSAGIEFAEATAKTMEIRQSEPVMEKIVNDYPIELEFTSDRPTVEVGCGPGLLASASQSMRRELK